MNTTLELLKRQETCNAFEASRLGVELEALLAAGVVDVRAGVSQWGDDLDSILVTCKTKEDVAKVKAILATYRPTVLKPARREARTLFAWWD